jgi:hypothetical protein
MTWTYSGDPSLSAKDEIRFLIGDTNADKQQLSDEEVMYIVGLHPVATGYPNYYGAAMAARTIASRYTDAISKSVGSLSLSLGDKRDKWAALAAELEKMAATGTGQVVGAPILGGGGPKYLGGSEWWNNGHSP